MFCLTCDTFQAADHRTNENDRGKLMNISGAKINVEG